MSGARGESAGSAAAVAALVGSFKVEEASLTTRPGIFLIWRACFPSTGDQVIVAVAQRFCWPVILGAVAWTFIEHQS